jgi:hypothetical protein
LATGLAVDFGSWWLLRTPWLTVLVVLAIALWWWLFLVLMPAQWRDMVHSQVVQGEGETELAQPPSIMVAKPTETIELGGECQTIEDRS